MLELEQVIAQLMSVHDRACLCSAALAVQSILIGRLDVTEAGGATPRSFANFAFRGECGRSVRVRHDENAQHTYVMTMAKMRFAGIL